MLGLKDIDKIIQGNSAGLKTVVITSLDNLGDGYTITDQAQLFVLHFRKNTAILATSGSEGDGGYVDDVSISAFLPKRRIEVEYMIQQLGNTKIAAYCIDRNEFKTFLVPTRLKHKYSSGAALGQDNGYEITLSSVDTRRIQYRTAVDEDYDGNEGTEDGDQTGGPSSPVGGSGGDGNSDFYVHIVPAQLVSEPTLSGNTTNLNSIVTAPDGHKWFIDIDGLGISLTGPTGAREILTVPGDGSSTYTIAATVPTDYAPANIIVTRQGVRLKQSDTPTDIDQYNYDGGDLVLATDWPLETGEEINIHILDYRP